MIQAVSFRNDLTFLADFDSVSALGELLDLMNRALLTRQLLPRHDLLPLQLCHHDWIPLTQCHLRRTAPLLGERLDHVLERRDRCRRRHFTFGKLALGSPVTDGQISFAGLRALHWYSMAMFPIILILYVVIAGINGDNLKAALTAPGTSVTPGGILGYGASLLGFTVTYSSLASDFVSETGSIQWS